MTLVIAFVHDGVAHLIGDTAATHDGPAALGPSSFGQPPTDGSRTVEERVPKVTRLGPDVFAAFAGDAANCSRFVRLLREDLRRSKDLRRSIEELSNVFDEQTAPFDVVLAHRGAGGPELTLFTTRSGIDDVTQDGCVLGSASEPLRMEITGRINSLLDAAKTNSSADLLHVVCVATLSSLAVTEVLSDQRIAGAFFGAFLSEHDASWQPPITFVLHTPGVFSGGHFSAGDASGLEMVHCFVLDDAAVVISSLLPQAKLMPSLGSPERTNADWDARLAPMFGNVSPSPVLSAR